MPGPNQWITQHVTIMSPLKTLLGQRRNSNFSPIHDTLYSERLRPREISFWVYCLANFNLRNVLFKTKVNTGDPHYWAAVIRDGTISLFLKTLFSCHPRHPSRDEVNDWRRKSQCDHYWIYNGEFIGQIEVILCAAPWVCWLLLLLIILLLTQDQLKEPTLKCCVVGRQNMPEEIMTGAGRVDCWWKPKWAVQERQ